MSEHKTVITVKKAKESFGGSAPLVSEEESGLSSHRLRKGQVQEKRKMTKKEFRRIGEILQILRNRKFEAYWHPKKYGEYGSYDIIELFTKHGEGKLSDYLVELLKEQGYAFVEHDWLRSGKTYFRVQATRTRQTYNADAEGTRWR